MKIFGEDRKRYCFGVFNGKAEAGKSTVFIEYMLRVIDESLGQLLNFNNRTLSAEDRLEYFVSLHKKEFTRKD